MAESFSCQTQLRFCLVEIVLDWGFDNLLVYNASLQQCILNVSEPAYQKSKCEQFDLTVVCILTSYEDI